MVSGVTGKTGNHVPGRVGLERSNVCARAAAHDQLLAGKIVLVLVVNQDLAKEYLAQVSEKSGVRSPFMGSCCLSTAVRSPTKNTIAILAGWVDMKRRTKSTLSLKTTQFPLFLACTGYLF